VRSSNRVGFFIFVYRGGDTMRKATIVAWPGALLLVFGLVSYSTSSNALGTSEERAACTPDVFRLCSSEIPSVSKIIACMKAKKAQLSPGCRAAFNPPEEKKAASQTRSMGPTASAWCNFKGVSHDPSQQDWIKWCGSAAKLR
jgi:hypothetical protein